jgi:hypothetical protein
MRRLITKIFPYYKNYRIRKVKRIIADQEEILALLIDIFNAPNGIARVHFPYQDGREIVIAVPIELLRPWVQHETERISRDMQELTVEITSYI